MLGRSRYFSTLDLASEYHYVEMDERDRENTAFSTAVGQFEYNRMSFGLMNHVGTDLHGV